ncbi:substrate-binding domain-containing protein [Cetobacterium sp. 8H]|uniref:substrate-binding domain-containing protein n=1 Tax=Cetobacterium sp. 8H TaxID=2759681 RepID=UPI00163CCC41|nr:substrate-binding domain-containing protein [Cetobacterium sp. 8H]MBC2850410.1 substrate-binding domain-containing protein [Cetobacterium sp. 8H]
MRKKLVGLAMILAGANVFAGEILMGTTTSLDDTGFLTEVSKVLKEEKGVDLKWIAKGTGEALELGKRGDVDILFTHDPGREEKFIQDGFGIKRYPLMYNYFVVVTNGERDLSNYPKDLNEVLKKISTENLTFISRGDKSGTHSKELSMWKTSGVDKNFKNYKEAGLGMGKTLNLTSELQAFTLSDSGTFLKVKDNFNLQEVTLNEKEPLKNIYSILELSNVQASKKDDIKVFIEFMNSDKATEIMKNFGKAEFGTPLFFVGK